MPAPRTFQGITKAEYSTDNSVWNDITKLVGDESGMTFPDQESNPQTYYKANYAGPQYVNVSITTLNRTTWDTILALWQADTEFHFRVTLDNDELHKWGAKIPSLMKPHDLNGIVEGRGDRFLINWTLLEEEITKTTA